MYNNVIIKNVSIYHPENIVTNEEIINHFNNQDIEIESLLNHLGRNIRYKTSSNENALTMAEVVGNKALNQAGINRDDIGLLYFVSDTPEQLVPTNSLILHSLLDTKNANITADFNANCIGMLSAIDAVHMIMKAKDIKYGLIIGSVFLSNIARPDDPIGYGTFGDGACAIILENIKSDKEFGFIGSNYLTNSSLHEMIQYPICGVSKMYDVNIDFLEKKLRFTPHDVSFFSEDWKNLILNMLKVQNKNINDIHHFLFSQFSKAEITETLEKLNVPFDKTTYVGDKYGYTGCTSPIFALYEFFQNNPMQISNMLNQYIVFCSVGAGYSMCSLTYKF